MSFLSDIGDWVSDRADDVKSTAGDIVSIVPGANWIGDQVQDFLRTDAGQIVAHALASTLTGGLAPVLGPQLASAAFATPGLIRGEKFDKAWIDEFQWRANRLADEAGPDAAQAFSSMLGPTIEKLKADFPTLGALGSLPPDIVPHIPDVQKVLSTPAWQIAVPRGLREDLTALSLGALARVPIPLDAYDVSTGKDTRVSDQERVRLLYPYATTFVADQMRSKVSRIAEAQSLANKMTSHVSLFAANEPPPSANLPPAPPAPATVPLKDPPLEKIANPGIRETPAPSPTPWGTYALIGGLAAAIGGAAWAWGRR